MNYQPVVEYTRGELVESIHCGAGVVADREGKIHAWWGDADAVPFMRSSSKPLQGLVVLESGAVEHFDLTPKEIAIICSSHSGTDEHVETVASIQAKIGVTEADMMCGVHEPFDVETARRLWRDGLKPTPRRHNCSGKHSGMLALARHIGAPLENYVHRDHPVQRRMLEAVASMCEIEPGEVQLGIDGCSVPTFAVPLRVAAPAFARLVDPSGLPPERAKACRDVVASMTAYPMMVAGPGRFDTRFMEVTEGRLLSKGGAEGYQAVGIPSGAVGPNSPALGLVAKIADGGHRKEAGTAVVLSVLEMLGAISSEESQALAEFGPQALTNARGLVIGRSRVCLELKRGG